MLSILSIENMARNKSVYTKTIAISEEDKEFVKKIREREGMQTEAGTLSHIINKFQETLYGKK
jgi:hypothetical protein